MLQLKWEDTSRHHWFSVDQGKRQLRLKEDSRGLDDVLSKAESSHGVVVNVNNAERDGNNKVFLNIHSKQYKVNRAI